jgi:signal transduction histidine kinase
VSQVERLDFPDAPRSDLERTIEDLMSSAHRVLATQGRLRHLLEANRAVVEQLDLEQVLRRIAEAAVSLVDARYGALGVIAPDGHLEQFIHVGIAESDARAIGHLPEGHGLLGAVVEAARPVRLQHLSEDPRSSGFPAHHPQMDGFLGVPIRVRGEVYGNLYLTNRADGPFTQEDEDLVTALAATAGIAIDNARLFDEAQRRQRWSTALAEVTSALLSGESDDILGIVVDRVASAIEAESVTITLPHSAGQVAGPLTATGADYPPGLTVSVPLIALGRELGVLTIARSAGSAPFADDELSMATEFAAQASVAIELARGRTDSQRLELADDRSRIARDLHDHVIQRLFATGLGLQSLAGRAPEELRAALSGQIDGIDAAIAEIRTAVFTLNSRPESDEPSLRHRVLDVVSELAPGLVTAPRLTFSGPVDLLIDGDLAADVIAVVREGLSNVIRHASASESSIDVSIRGDAVSVMIDDDGAGVSRRPTRSSGTKNLAARAAEHGGTFDLSRRTPRGTTMRWTALLPDVA